MVSDVQGTSVEGEIRMSIQKGDGVITKSGSRGIVVSGVFKMTSLFDRYAVAVAFDYEDGTLEMPIDVAWICEVWRNGARIDNVEQLE